MAASVWGCGADPAEAPDKAYIRRWNTTANALEGLAAAHNDGLLVLDEIGTCGAHDFGRIVYDLMGGQGKAAMNSERALRQVRSWRSLVLSTGEISVAQRVQQDGGRQPHAGQRVRFMDLPAGDSVITAPDSGSDAAVYAQALKRACADCYGTAGPAFLEALVSGYSTEAALSEAVQTRLEEARSRLAVPGLPAEAVRALDRLALVLVAGEWAAETGIVSLEQAEIGSAVDFVRRAWLADGGHIAEGDRGVMMVRDFILRHGSRFADASDSGGPDVRDLVGYIDKRYQLYLFTSEGFAEACQGMDPRQVSTALKERGLLATNEGDRHQSKRSIPAKGDRRIRFYAVRMGIVEVEDGFV